MIRGMVWHAVLSGCRYGLLTNLYHLIAFRFEMETCQARGMRPSCAWAYVHQCTDGCGPPLRCLPGDALEKHLDLIYYMERRRSESRASPLWSSNVGHVCLSQTYVGCVCDDTDRCGHCFSCRYTTTRAWVPVHCTGGVPAGIAHLCTCHTCIPTFSKPPCMHTFIYILAVFPTHNSACAISFTPACACRTCIDQILTSSHIHYSDEPNAIIFIQVLALSHRAQVLIRSVGSI